MYAYRFDTESHRKFGEGPGLTSARMRWFWDKAFPRPNAPFAQPLDAILEDLPAIHVIAAGRDCLRDDSRELAMRLRLAGVEVIYREYDGVRHSFLQFSRFLPAAHAAITNWSATLRKHCQVTGDTRT
jgi:acetyl esterase